MNDAETIAALKAELEQQRKSSSYMFEENCRLQTELNRLQDMRGVLWTLCRLTRETDEARKAQS